ncbi:hypothetical protein [Apilactobacillus timberlakei]|uniref:hypothetical protein n=1 Tax=Apilactobacillus timberlakei TaxID=2008380 RepID=UPI00112627F6|nr:hypothetical protein [Apilactobacillus timberlakei]TPR16285.1 hypothetical protein DYZ95_07915 [Apilactobacillus timberlakei]TPR21544.1 hypothetical protein DY083_05855 [Apilactobacillus timberlakei]
MDKNYFGVVDQVKKSYKIWGPVLLRDFFVAVSYLMVINYSTVLFSNANSSLYYWTFSISLGLYLIYLRLPSGSNPFKSNFRMIMYDIKTPSKMFYQSLEEDNGTPINLRLSLRSKRMLQGKEK